jgi:hypothetical protein
VVGALPGCPLPLGLMRPLLVACGLTAVSYSTFPGPESLYPVMGACVIFASLCSCSCYSVASFTTYKGPS